MADFSRVPRPSGDSTDKEKDPNCPTEITYNLERKNLRSAIFRHEGPFKEVLQSQGEIRYTFSLARSMVGEAYGVALQLKKFDDDLSIRDGGAYDEGPIATATATPYLDTGIFLESLSVNTEGMLEDLYTYNGELVEIRSHQVEILALFTQLIALAQDLKRKFQKLILHPLRRVDSSNEESHSDSDTISYPLLI